ncbi:alpha beta-hydrolase [Coniophora puteana RWD-64-598 SS2]|uniref:Alpha beta-hydrolase n=1 Tax=Coniophora puteana (strain RWD-64-598) TaxID=741705 RepID=A0A5M3M9V5_CONPW|nr:alpha beta-hydrolase [Coniophora puteana RWD-64-598 SS2]EIW75425.1 alpha beta-hydrolase [Coniophora puteana RWD-64-598 SS2]
MAPPNFTLSVATWGNPSSSKNALLIHGLTSVAQTWHRVARDLAGRGYYVLAPDLPGHGMAGSTQSFTIAALAEALAPLFSAPYPRFDLIIAHSLGAVTTLQLLHILPPFSQHPAAPVNSYTRVLLLDPPLYQSPRTVEMARTLFMQDVASPRSAAQHMSENPRWTLEDAAWKELGEQLITPETIDHLFKDNSNWSFVHLLKLRPATQRSVYLTVLGADPHLKDQKPSFRVEQAQPYLNPRLDSGIVWGATHGIHREFPEVVVEHALRRLDERNAVSSAGEQAKL